MNALDGMNYAPKGKPEPVVKEGEFYFAYHVSGSRSHQRHVQWPDGGGSFT